MEWIYLSPHFDDAALSCGGLIWEQTRVGQGVTIWTVCGGGPPKHPLSPFARNLHNRWKTGPQAVKQRRMEDRASAEILGASTRTYTLPDCIYRYALDKDEIEQLGKVHHLYSEESAIFDQLHPSEIDLPEILADALQKSISHESKIVSPLALGGHVDHRLTRRAAELLQRPLWYYPDYPYVLEEMDQLDRLQSTGWKAARFQVSEPGISAWLEAVEVYQSQISTFWVDTYSMKASLRSYARKLDGVQLWRPPNGW